MTTYGKLVRDQIPNIIRAQGLSCRTRALTEPEFREALRAKFTEEWDEYLHAADDPAALEELADLSEVLHALAEVHGFPPKDLEAHRAAKSMERGGFRQRLFLIDVES